MLLLSFISVAILLTIFPGRLQSHSQPAVFVPPITENYMCHTDMSGSSNCLIDLFAVEQDYFVYAEHLHLNFPKGKEGKMKGIARKGVAEKSYEDP